jgi:hypothetical protein
VTFDATHHTLRLPQFQQFIDMALDFLNTTPTQPLPLLGAFAGSGVYALYYLGNFPPYSLIARQNHLTCKQPIYVGKAVPPGWRTSRNPDPAAATLYHRLQEHARSLQQGADLDPADIRCRLAILNAPESDLITILEAELIRRYQPLWNAVIDGFGNHDPGSGRYNQARSEWDVLHPGRLWAAKLEKITTTREALIAKVQHALIA